MLFYILMIIIGFILLVFGANLLVKGSSNIAYKFNIPETIIGLTIVALGTSAPELIITINSAINGSTDLIIGNAIGSNLCNILLILGLMAILRPVLIDKSTKNIHIPISLLSTLIILLLDLTGFITNSFLLDKKDGIVLISLFLIYFTYPIIIEIKDVLKSYANKTFKIDNKKNASIIVNILFIIIGVIMLKYGGDFVVDYSTNIARYFDILERIIGLTIIAIGTAMPELVTSIIAIYKKDTDLAIGNLIGSCVINLLLILGIGAIITPLEFSKDFTNNLILLCISTFILWLFNYTGKQNTITRFKGFILLLIFIGYMYGLFKYI